MKIKEIPQCEHMCSLPNEFPEFDCSNSAVVAISLKQQSQFLYYCLDHIPTVQVDDIFESYVLIDNEWVYAIP